jgi:hypothetical protein
MIGGAGLMLPSTRRLAGWWLIATLVAILPANVWMAQHPERYRIPGAGRCCWRGCRCRRRWSPGSARRAALSRP